MRPLLPLLALALLSACVRPSAPAPRPQPRPVPMPVPSATPTPRGADWTDWPLTPGDWSYRQEAGGSQGSFGVGGAVPVLTLRCDLQGRRVLLSRTGASAAVLSVRTSTAQRTLLAIPVAGGAVAELAARDPLLDAMGFSRGRFIVSARGLPDLVVPAWAEVLRVVEDCRG